jgi:signal transduction histidine kinase/HPt (histidine-containing phosphotransfer) domain-containing protein
MKHWKDCLLTLFDKLLDKKLELRARVFNLLGMVGMLISLIVALSNAIIGAGATNIALSLASSVFAALMLYYANRSGRFHRCYVITIITVFIIAFPVMFFTTGGYHSGMPSYFVFAVVFTVFMLGGAKSSAMVAFEISLYAGICLFAYFYPESVSFFESEFAIAADTITGFIVSSLMIVSTVTLVFQMYVEQQRRLKEASDAKTAFLANMSHEIRTPLNVILGMNEMIQSVAPTGSIADWSGDIQTAGYALRQLIDELLNISKIEAGRQEIVETEYRVQDLIYDLSIIGEQETKKRGLDFTVEADSGMPSKLSGDFSRIRQIVTNFLVNAAKYTERGTVTLTAGCVPAGAVPMNDATPDEHENIVLSMSVSDTGIGIKQEDIGSLFEKYSRAGADMAKAFGKSRRHEEGVGLGLAIAKQLSDLMNGKINVESVWGEGSAFTLSLPQRLIDAVPLGNWRAGFSAEPEPFAGDPEILFIAPEGRVLAVDDNPGNLRVVKEYLRRTRLRADIVPGGRECVDAVKHALEEGDPYHVILMDYMMPDMDGIETLEKLLEEVPGFAAPVVALTADAVTGEREKFLSAGFAAYLSKPITRSDLEQSIFALLPKDLIAPFPGGDFPKTPDSPDPEGKSEKQADWESDLLSEHGVSLSEGIKYASGDRELFREQACTFKDAFASERRVIELKRDDGDWAGMARLVHGLKSWAGYVGAVAVRDTALKIERACRADDVEYVRIALPLLFLEWERACLGFGDFLRRQAEEKERSNV